MIKNEKINLRLNPRHLSHFKSLGYKDIKCNNIIEIFTTDLPNNSNLKIDVICDNCSIEKSIKYQDYNKHTSNRTTQYYCSSCSSIKIKNTIIEKYGIHYTHLDEYKEKIKTTTLTKYGVTHYSKTDEYKQKFKDTCLEKYGFDNPFKSFNLNIQTNKRKSMVNSGSWISLSEKTEWELYKGKVRNITRKNVKLLEWDGTDFYDNEYIKENFSLNHIDNNYPTIDHKTSIFDGFMNNIPIDEIASVDNLCWTKRIINITKNKKSHN